MGRQPPILQILGAAGASLSKFKLLVCLLKLQRFLLVWWDLTRSPVHCADGEMLWQQHGEQRRRVEVLRSVHRTTRAVIGKKRLKSHPDVASWKSTVFFCLLLFAAEWSCIEVQTRVAGQGCRSGLQVRVRSDVQVRSAAFLTWRLFWFRWG
jgi:hypothetical protein